MKKKLPHEVKLTVVKTSLGYTAYDPVAKNSMDVFPYTEEGKERLLEFLEKLLDRKVEPFFKD